MGSYNNLLFDVMTCPRCRRLVHDVAIECFFGDTSRILDLAKGDHYPWRERKAVKNGGRPDGGDFDGEGYAECPACGKDFFVKVIIRLDKIVGVEADTSRPGYIPD